MKKRFEKAKKPGVMVGDVVVLNSGGPRMTVREISPTGRTHCDWIGDDGWARRAWFQLVCLHRSE